MQMMSWVTFLFLLLTGCGREPGDLPLPLDGALEPAQHSSVVRQTRRRRDCIDPEFVRSLRLARPTRLYGIEFPIGSTVSFQEPLGCSAQEFKYIETVDIPAGVSVAIEILAGSPLVPCTGRVEFAVQLRKPLSCDAFEAMSWGGKVIAEGQRIVFASLLSRL